MKQNKKNMTRILIGVIAALAAILVVLIVVLVATPNAQISSHSAQAEAEAEEKALKEAEKEGYYDTDPIEVVDLTELIGTDLDQALELIGHGAEIDGDPTLVAGGLTEVTVLLGEESATIDTGAALTHLYLDKSGHVVAANYRININDLSCATLPFDRIVNEAHLVERLLVGAGLTDFQPDPVVAPAKEEYAHYDSSGKTIVEERYQFVGTGSVPLSTRDDVETSVVAGTKSALQAGNAARSGAEKGTPQVRQLEWSVLLDYDYEQAIEANNLAKTVRTVQVSINSVAS